MSFFLQKLSTSILRGRISPEKKFWQWFENNEEMLFDFESDQERIFKLLQAKMGKLHPDLSFEFGPKENGRREFVISAGGIREAFPNVEALYAAAPSLTRWKFVKFRPRRQGLDLRCGDIAVRTATASVYPEFDGQRVNVTVFIPGYTPKADTGYRIVTYLLLDNALGEFDVETRVGEVRVESISQAPVDAIPIEALARVVDDYFSGKGRPNPGPPAK